MTGAVPPAAGRVVLPVLEQHAEEAAFLWHLRDRATDQPHFRDRHLARLEERIAAHLEGLHHAGATGLGLVLAQLDRFPEAGEAFAAAAAALQAGDPAALRAVLEVGAALPAAAHGLAGAVGWTRPERLKPWVRGWLEAGEPFARRLGVTACALHRRDPGPRLALWLEDADPLPRARALRLVGELGRADLALAVTRRIDDADPDCRFWAAWSAALVGERATALPVLEAAAEAGGEFTPPALHALVAVAGQERATAWIRSLNADPAHGRLVVQALGLLGDPAAIPWLLGRMGDPLLARLAGESFALITGVDLAYDDLEGEAPAELVMGPSDEPADEDVAADPDEHLPWPAPDLLTEWWERNRHRFAAGTRHLLGEPLGAAAAEAAFARGFQRQRRAGAYALAATAPTRRLENWRARVGIDAAGRRRYFPVP